MAWASAPTIQTIMPPRRRYDLHDGTVMPVLPKRPSRREARTRSVPSHSLKKTTSDANASGKALTDLKGWAGV